MKKILNVIILFIILSFLYNCNNKQYTTVIENEVTEEMVEQTIEEDDYIVKYNDELKDKLVWTTNRTNSNQGTMIIDTPQELERVIIDTPQELGTLIYKVDSVLIIGVASRVEARIIKQISEEITEHLISLTTHTITGVIYEEIIRVGNIMDMELKSLDPNAFIITEITSEEQIVDESDVTQWIWSVIANKTGNYNLIMTAKIKEDGPSRDIIIFDRAINVVNKPKQKYSTFLYLPNELKRYDDNIFKLNIIEKNTDTYNIEWGGEGKVVLEFDGKVTITSNDNVINNNKPTFEYKWLIIPEGKEKNLPFTIKIIGDYEDLILFEGDIKVKNNLKESFNRFIDNVVKRWYWVFTALLIPLFTYIRKKYFKKEK